jgi:ABC-type Fe3+ transport system substrate-binding protein
MSSAQSLRLPLIAALGCIIAAGAAHAVEPTPVTPELVAAATKEGKVVWYASEDAQLVAAVTKAFEAKYPGIAAQGERNGAERNFQRVSQEYGSSIHAVDVITSSNPGPVLYWKSHGMLAQFVPTDVARFPANQRDADGYYATDCLTLAVMGYNTKLLKPDEAPKSYADLLDPKWKGRMAWNVQPSVSAGQGLVGSILIAWGEEKARAYLAKLAKQDITPLLVSGRQVLDLVITGEYPIGLQIFNNHAYISASKGAPVDWIKMQPPLITFAVMSVPKGAPSPNAGKLLIDYIVSPEGQRIIADAGELPVHPGVKPRDPTLIPDGVTFKGSFLTPEELDKELVTWTKIFDEYFR